MYLPVKFNKVGIGIWRIVDCNMSGNANEEHYHSYIPYHHCCEWNKKIWRMIANFCVPERLTGTHNSAFALVSYVIDFDKTGQISDSLHYLLESLNTIQNKSTYFLRNELLQGFVQFATHLIDMFFKRILSICFILLEFILRLELCL